MKKGAAMLEVRVARPDEFDAVLAFYTTMIDEMQGTDFDVQWQHGVHPSPAFLRESLEAAQLIVGLLPAEEVEVVSEGGESEPIIASAMVVNHEGAPGYNAVPWAVDAAPEQVGVLHVVATLPAFHGRGFGRQLVNGAADIARAQGLVALRLDTFPPQRTRPRPLRVVRFRGQGRVDRALPGPRRHPGGHVRAGVVAFANAFSRKSSTAP